MLRGLTSFAVVTVVVALTSLPPALASSRDTATTRSYLRANYALLRIAQRNITASETAYKSVLHRVTGECPHAGLSSPQDPQSTEMSNEVIGAMVLSAAKPDLAAIKAYLRAVAGLHWSRGSINHSVSDYSSMLATSSRLAPPNLCAEVRAWAASGFQTVPGSTVAFDKQFLPNWVALGLVPASMRSLEDAEGRALAQRSHAIEVQITDVEARAVETWGEIMNELMLEP